MGVGGLGMAMGLKSTAVSMESWQMHFKLLQMQQYQKLQLEHYLKLLRVLLNALGLAGNVDANALQALTQGRVFNPYSEQLFNNMEFSDSQFLFQNVCS